MPLDAQTTQLLERYLDGAMSAQELAAFEIRLLREHELRAVVEGQRVIDLSLRRPGLSGAMSATVHTARGCL